MIYTCEKCGKQRSDGSKSLCLSCWREQQHLMKENNKITCVRCGEIKKHYGKGYCEYCYHKEFFKEKHARYERNRRKNKREQILESERIRSQSPGRQEWKRQYHKKYYAEHKEELLEYQKNYRRSDLERQKNYKLRRRARVRELEDTLTVEEWHDILEKYNHSCAYCGITDVFLEREHKTPASRGGGYTKENIVPSCGSCNRSKKTMTHDEFMEYRQKYG